ncbi:MAG: 8-amino-7-oxononanoate synthase [Planctomycetota bacterium]
MPHDATGLDALLLAELSDLRRDHRERTLRPFPDVGKFVEVEGRRLLNLASNDYLGLANHPKLAAAGREAISAYGTGATASRLVCGSLEIHRQAELKFANLKHAEAALLFAAGYSANLAVLTALAGPGDLICQDKLNHASLLDAARFSGARVRTYPHLDLSKLERLLAQHAKQTEAPVAGEDFWDQVQPDAREAAGLEAAMADVELSTQPASTDVDPIKPGTKRFIVTDTVFSMDGDCANLPALCDLADRYRAVLVIDEAHATGVLGVRGGGLAQHQGVAERVYRCGLGGVVVSTASKAMGGLGGLVTGSQVVIDYLINRARPFIYSTGVAPAQAAVVAAAADIILQDTERRQRLAEHCRTFAAGLTNQGWPVAEHGPTTPIFPLMVGTESAALALARRLQEQGVLAVAIRPPTVAPGTARVRCSLRADLDDQDLEQVLEAIGRAL